MKRVSRRDFLGGLGVAGGVVWASAAGRPGPAMAAGATRSVMDPGPDFVPRSVARVIPPVSTRVGDVFKVRRTFPTGSFDAVDPFLLLDHFDFTMAPGELGGLAPHPHRGFETVTVLLGGAIEHGDCLGNRGQIQDGDVQWMTAGSGIVHEENPADVIREKGGRILGLQLWVNLPRRSKMQPPKYQDTVAAQIPVVTGGGVTARVIAGEAHGTKAVIGTHTPLTLIHYTLAPGASVALTYPTAWSAWLHVVAGLISTGPDPGASRVGEAHLAHLGHDGQGVRLHNPTGKSAQVILGGGLPLDEPIARRGPFVMNTAEEIRQAMVDYRTGRMGRVDNPTYDRIKLR